MVLFCFFVQSTWALLLLKTKTNHLRKGEKIIYQNRVRKGWSEVPGVSTGRTSGKTRRWHLWARCGATDVVEWKGEDSANTLWLVRELWMTAPWNFPYLVNDIFLFVWHGTVIIYFMTPGIRSKTGHPKICTLLCGTNCWPWKLSEGS